MIQRYWFVVPVPQCTVACGSYHMFVLPWKVPRQVLLLLPSNSLQPLPQARRCGPIHQGCLLQWQSRMHCMNILLPAERRPWERLPACTMFLPEPGCRFSGTAMFLEHYSIFVLQGNIVLVLHILWIPVYCISKYLLFIPFSHISLIKIKEICSVVKLYIPS